MTLMPVWPAGFLPTPELNGWDGMPFDTRAAFSPESGPPIFRKRVTAEAWQFSGRFPTADQAEQAAFWTFWEEIDQGALSFLWRDPVSQAVRRWIFAADEPVRTSGVSDTHRDFQLQLIRLPSTPWWAALMPPGDLVAPRAAYDMARGLYHNGVAQIGQTAAIGSTLTPGLVTAHGLSDVRYVLAAGPTVVTLRNQTLASGWWPAGQSFAAVASIAIFVAGALP